MLKWPRLQYLNKENIFYCLLNSDPACKLKNRMPASSLLVSSYQIIEAKRFARGHSGIHIPKPQSKEEDNYQESIQSSIRQDKEASVPLI